MCFVSFFYSLLFLLFFFFPLVLTFLYWVFVGLLEMRYLLFQMKCFSESGFCFYLNSSGLDTQVYFWKSGRYSSIIIMSSVDVKTAVCKRCLHDANGKGRISEWFEHWFFLNRKIDMLSREIEQLESRLCLAVEKKRCFQKIFEKRWGQSPPEIIARGTLEKCHGYIWDLIEEEYENVMDTKALERTEMENDSKKGMLRRVFSMSTREKRCSAEDSESLLTRKGWSSTKSGSKTCE